MRDSLAVLNGMTDTQRLLFMSEFNQRRKEPSTGILLALFLGGVGAHRFYLGQVGLGVLYLLFCWTFIPVFISFIEAFLMTGRISRYNERVATDIALKIRALSTPTV